MHTPTSRRHRLSLIGVGIVAGFLSGLFGIGGGIVVVPGLVLLVAMGERIAAGTSVAAVLLMSASGLVGYAIHAEVDVVRALLLVAGSIGGALLGTHLLAVMPVRVVRLIFAVITVLTAVRMLWETPDHDSAPGLTVLAAVALVLLGFLTGVLSGLLGVGGGVIMVPAMTVLLGVPVALAKGTSLLVMLPTALTATWSNRRRGNVDLRAAALVGVSGMASAFAGSQVSVRLDAGVASALFAALLVVVAVRIVLTTRRRAEPTGLADSTQ